jgi:uncharacterized membrane protein
MANGEWRFARGAQFGHHGGAMTEIEIRSGSSVPSEGHVRLTHLLYALHAFSALTGVLTAAVIVMAFLTGWPSIIAVIINYVKRPDVRGTYLDSHFSWQLRTFWYALLWVALMFILVFTVIGIPLAWLIGLVVGLWVLYRIIRGWLALLDGRPMPMPTP